MTGADWHAVVEGPDGSLRAHRCDAALTQTDGVDTRDVLAVVDRTTGEIVPVEDLSGYRWVHRGTADEAVQSYVDFVAVAPVVAAEAHLHEVAAQIAEDKDE